MLRMITNWSPSPKLKPLPRAAQTNRSPSPAPLRGFPLPLWRGVNGIANHSRTGSLCPVLQKEARVFTPLSNGEGMGVGLLVSVPCSPTRSKGIHSPLRRGWGFCIFMQYCERFLKPIKLQSESMGFRL